MITTAHQKESLSRAYVQIIAARCGLSWSSPSPDYGVDIILHNVEEMDGQFVQSGYPLEIQVKSTSAAILEKSEVKYDMEIGAFKKLRNPSVVTAGRILVLLVLPEDESEWTTVTDENLILRRCAYWLSLKGRDAVDNQSKVRINIPRENVFSDRALRDIMSRRDSGEEL